LDDLFSNTGIAIHIDRDKRIKKLLNLVKQAKQAYYNEQPIISDVEYDALEDELRQILKDRGDDPDKFIPIGAEVEKNKFVKATHKIPMGSQTKCANEEEFSEWWRLHNLNNEPMVATNKLDGASLALYYENGKLVQAITRGDGVEGRDITPNAKKFVGVPLTIDETDDIAVRGECILSVENWNKVDPENEKNPRNLGTGIMGREDGTDCDKLNFIAFEICGFDFDTEMKKLRKLRDLGFDSTFYKKCDTYKDLIEFYNNTNNLRKDNAVAFNGQNFWIDGLVVKINSVQTQEKLGESSGRPKWSTALKFPSPGAITILEDIEYGVGYTGAITPVGIIKPVEIGGTTVSRVTLNNWDYIKTKNIALNDKVKVIKSGDIIPKLVDVLERPAKGRSNRIVLEEPTSCPRCGGSVGRETNTDGSDAAVLKCQNPYCEAKVIGKFKRIVDKLNILEIGESIIVAMNKSGILLNLGDLFRLENRRDEIMKLEVGNGVWGESRTDKMIEKIGEKKEMTLDMFLGILGISGLGQRRAKMIIEKGAGTMDTIDDWKSNILVKNGSDLGVPGIAQSIHDQILEMDDDITDLLDVISIKGVKKVSGVLSGKSFVLTGSMSRSRKEIEKDIEAVGGEIHSSVSKNTTYLVQADPGSVSSKSKKADKLGVKIIGEEELMEIINV